MNIFDMRGPDFLALYFALLVGGIAVASALRMMMRRRSEGIDVRALQLDPVDIALLAEGERHVAQTALASLVQRDLVTMEASSRRFWAKGRPSPDATRVEQRIHVLIGSAGKSLDEVVTLTQSLLEPARRRLESTGLLLVDEERKRLRLVPAAALAAVLVIGLLKVAVGMSRQRPVGNLMGLCLLTFIGIVVFFATAPRRSRLGDDALQSLRMRNLGLRTSVTTRPDRVAPDDLSLAVALYGVSIIQVGPLTVLRDICVPKPTVGDSSTTGSSCSSGGGCGGGGGGCGGCGS